ncbi:MAG: hypothetical protein ACJ75J_15290 [Cytophagaceae bacterium]
MKLFLLVLLLFLSSVFLINKAATSSTAISNQHDSLPGKNKQVLDYVIKNGANISPTYEQAVCTELVIGVLKNFIALSTEDKKKIRIITNENVYALRLNNSPIPKGVYHTLTSSGKGTAINHLSEVRPGDFVQFWYAAWGHCGIVSSIDQDNKTMQLHSSFPSTNGYGIQTFDIPDECYFVRLK